MTLTPQARTSAEKIAAGLAKLPNPTEQGMLPVPQEAEAGPLQPIATATLLALQMLVDRMDMASYERAEFDAKLAGLFEPLM